MPMGPIPSGSGFSDTGYCGSDRRRDGLPVGDRRYGLHHKVGQRPHRSSATRGWTDRAREVTSDQTGTGAGAYASTRTTRRNWNTFSSSIAGPMRGFTYRHLVDQAGRIARNTATCWASSTTDIVVSRISRHRLDRLLRPQRVGIGRGTAHDGPGLRYRQSLHLGPRLIRLLQQFLQLLLQHLRRYGLATCSPGRNGAQLQISVVTSMRTVESRVPTPTGGWLGPVSNAGYLIGWDQRPATATPSTLIPNASAASLGFGIKGSGTTVIFGREPLLHLDWQSGSTLTCCLRRDQHRHGGHRSRYRPRPTSVFQGMLFCHRRS